MTLLRTYAATDQKDWSAYLNLVLLSYRTSVHSSTKVSPFRLVYGHEANLPLHMLSPEVSGCVAPTSMTVYATGLADKIKSINTLVKQRLQVAGLAQKKQKDKAVHPSKVEVGDFVYVWTPNSTPGISPKLASNWSGPILVIARDDPNVMLEWPGKSRKYSWVDLDHTKRFAAGDGTTHDPTPDYSPIPSQVKEENGDGPRYNLRPRASKTGFDY